jgi:Effector-associated domain 11
MPDTPQPIAAIRELIARNDLKTALLQITELTKGTNQQDVALQLAGRYNETERQNRMGLLSFQEANLAQNQVRASILALLRDMEDQDNLKPAATKPDINPTQKNVVNNSTITAGGNVTIGDRNITQNHSGSGDNVAGDKIMGDKVAGNKIGRQINITNGTYNENTPINYDPKPAAQTSPDMPTNPLPETPSGIFGQLFNTIPKPFNSLIAILLIAGAAYVGYRYFIPPKEAPVAIAPPTQKEVYVSGKILIDNGEPKPNEVKRLSLKNMPNVNAATLDATGKYTFSNVTLPANKKLLVYITFNDGKTFPTTEINVNDHTPDDHTVYMPDLYIDRPKTAKGGQPAKPWTINVSQQTIIQNHSGQGDNNATQK